MTKIIVVGGVGGKLFSIFANKFAERTGSAEASMSLSHSVE